MEEKKGGKRIKRITLYMKKKLTVSFVIIVLLFVALLVRVVMIQQSDGEAYKKKVLEQQVYASKTIPYKRGAILDRNSTILAISEDVYNVILDCYVVNSEEKYHNPTIEALTSNIPDVTAEEIEEALTTQSENRYFKLRKKLEYEEIEGLEKAIAESDYLPGVWLEKEYKRNYPYSTLASSILGFSGSDNVGYGGIEAEYNSYLNGKEGRQYGYINEENNMQSNYIDAKDGYSVISTVDAHIQSIVENYMKKYFEEYKDNFEERPGCMNMGVIVMDPDTAEVLAMSDYPLYDLNNPYDLSALYTEEEIAGFEEAETKNDVLNALWNNYCISSTFEPGSTFKLFTVAAGLETGKLTGDETYECDGHEVVAGETIHCVNRTGHGTETVMDAISDSCNDALMQMAATIGKDAFCQYQNIFNFGLKTTIDLQGEASTLNLIYYPENIGPVELATNSFGQGFNCTMIQTAAAYCSLVNGGNYYQPRVVKKLVDEDGVTVKTYEPILLKQTISQATSEKLMSYMKTTVDVGTAKAAQLEKYTAGGKTGTAEKLPRGSGKYVVSFAGYAPATNPEVLIYVVIDEPNIEFQDAGSSLASTVAKNILSEVLPYMGVTPDKEIQTTE